MSMVNYSISFDCYESAHWDEYQCDFADAASYNEMVNGLRELESACSSGMVEPERVEQFMTTM